MAAPSNSLKPSALSKAGTFPWGNLDKNSGFLLSTKCSYEAGVAISRPAKAATTLIWSQEDNETNVDSWAMSKTAYRLSFNQVRYCPQCSNGSHLWERWMKEKSHKFLSAIWSRISREVQSEFGLQQIILKKEPRRASWPRSRNENCSEISCKIWWWIFEIMISWIIIAVCNNHYYTNQGYSSL